jgi:hypothetical protein
MRQCDSVPNATSGMPFANLTHQLTPGPNRAEHAILERVSRNQKLHPFLTVSWRAVL